MTSTLLPVVAFGCFLGMPRAVITPIVLVRADTTRLIRGVAFFGFMGVLWP